MSEFIETPLGILPRSWQIKPLGETTTKIQDGTHFSPQTDEGPCLYLTSKNIKFGRFDIKDCGWISQQEHDSIYARCDVKYGDVLLTKDGANTGNACLNDLTEPFSLLSSVAFLRTDGVTNHSGFILQYLLSPLGQRRLKDLMSGNAIPRLTLQKIKAIKTPVPTPDEQRRIATILSTLDEVIEATEKLLEKHQQIKAGLMHDLFTRGLWTRPELARGDHHGLPCEATAQEGQLRPTPEKAPGLYQDSPLGLIPNAWKEMPLDEHVRIIDCKHYTPEFRDEGYLFIRPRNVKVDGLDLNSVDYVSEEDFHLLTDVYRPRRGDIVFSRNASFGVPCYVDIDTPFAIGQDVVIMAPKASNTRFVFAALTSNLITGQIAKVSAGSTFGRINLSEIRKLRVPQPDPDEQDKIATRFDAADSHLRQLQHDITKLRQQKQGLMHDLLTGRVRA